MLKRRVKTSTMPRRGRSAAGVCVVAGLVSVLALMAASSALAEPKGIFNRFKQCPTEVAGVTLCQFAQTKSGEFVLGTSKVPINKTITIQGGGIPINETETEFALIPAKNGESLSKTELNVPGGLTGLINCEEITGSGFFEKAAREACKAIFENKTTGVTATTELVANAHNPAILNEVALVTREGTALTLPVRVHLKNPLLGNSCYIGSEASPLELKLTTGTSGGLTGKRGETESQEEKGLELLHIFNNSLVDNTFTAPGSEGCGEFLFIKGYLDGILNSKLKIPNKAGENAARLNGELYATTVANVVASEKF
jgi:hypothetical protein